MKQFHKCIDVYKEQLKEGCTQVAYKGLIEYITSLRLYFYKKYAEFHVPSNIYIGYMDMTYFSIIPNFFKDRKLKIAIVFNYEIFGFEVWLSAVNKTVLKKYWDIIKIKNWDNYRVVKPDKGIDSILEFTIVRNPDLRDLDALTKEIEKKVLDFINDLEKFLIQHEK